MPTPTTERYVPAAGRAWLTRLYDPVMALTMRERAFRPALLAAVLEDPRPARVLDVGCGTGTLARELAEADPVLNVAGVDGDQRVLAIAQAKLQGDAARVRLTVARADALPLADGSVDVVVQSLLLHHLAPAAKLGALGEARRVLAPGGRLVIADWGSATGALTRCGFTFLRLLDGWENTADHAAGRLPALVAWSGFGDLRRRRRWPTVWGSLELITALAPEQ